MRRPVMNAGECGQASIIRSSPGRTRSARGPRAAPRPGAPRQLVQVRGRVLVELQHAGERVEHLLGRVPVAPLLEAHVVVRGDAGEHRQLLAAQAGHAAAAVVAGMPTSSGRTRSRRARRKSPMRLSEDSMLRS